jgi:ribosome maturation factor RimP
VNKSPLTKKIERLITPTVEAMGFEIVRVLLIGSGKPTLQIMAERPEGGITLDECGKLSQAISAILDVENVLDETPYYLEVGSPGIDRPLTRLKDFERYAGHEAKIEIEPAVDARKRFRGLLKGISGEGISGETILIQTEEGAKEIPFSFVEKAKLVVTDDQLMPKQQRKKAH